MARASKPTITDVARAAGVAIGTVSRVINNYSDVNPELQAKVRQAAESLKYTRIRQRSTRRASAKPHDPSAQTIAAVFFGMEDTLVQLPIVSSALQGIEGALSDLGRSLMLSNIPKGDRIPPFIQAGLVKGLILKGPNQGGLPPPPYTPFIAGLLRLPHVWLMGRPQNATGDHCNFDADAAGAIAALHFFEKGHRRIAFLNPKPGQIQFEKLKDGYRAAASAKRMECLILENPRPESIDWPLPAITHADAVAQLLQRWIELPASKRPTAVFVPSDRAAVQLYAAMDRRGLQAARDLSVISCNNEHSLLMNLHPKVATIDVHADFIGRRAVEQLLRRIDGAACEHAVQILIEPTLVPGDSVATIPH